MRSSKFDEFMSYVPNDDNSIINESVAVEPFTLDNLLHLITYTCKATTEIKTKVQCIYIYSVYYAPQYKKFLLRFTFSPLGQPKEEDRYDKTVELLLPAQLPDVIKLIDASIEASFPPHEKSLFAFVSEVNVDFIEKYTLWIQELTQN